MDRRAASTAGPASRSGPVTALWAVYALVMAGVSASWILGGPPVENVAGPVMLTVSVVTSILALKVVRRRDLDARSRQAWRLMAVAFAVITIAYMLFAMVDESDDPSAFPNAGDGLRLLFVPILLAGLLRLPSPRPDGREASKLALDIGIVLTGSAVLLWYLDIGPLFAQGDRPTFAVLVAAAYPIGDLVLIFGATSAWFRGASSSGRRPVLLLGSAVAFLVAGDVYLGYQRARPLFTGYASWQYLCWLTAGFLLALAAAEQLRGAPQIKTGVDAELRIGAVPLLPYVAVAIGYALLVMVALRQAFYPYGGVVIGAVAMTGLVVIRQVVALRENRRLVVTDSLTGLANRMLLRHELAGALERGQRTGDPVAVLLMDLDGFKEINDSLGHEAGDAMLVAFARILEGSVRASDTVARVGGDEFAVVLQADDPVGSATVVAERIKAAMRATVVVAGQALQPRASIGIATSTDGITPSELLHQADVDMYRAKRTAAERRHPSRSGAATA